MMTSENYSTPRKYKVDATPARLYDKENNVKDTAAYFEDNAANQCKDKDYRGTAENASESPSSRRSRTRRSKDHVSEDSPCNSEEVQVEGATAQSAEKSKGLKKEKASGKKRKERKNLREKRRSTGVVIMPGAANDEQADEARQTMENTKMNESIGNEDYSLSPNEGLSSSKPSRSSRLPHNDGDVEKQDLLDRIEQLEKALEQKTKEVETLKSENQALLRVVNQVSSLKMK